MKQNDAIQQSVLPNKAGHTAAFGGWTRGQAACLCRRRYAIS
jgi:hypothetical protein